MKLDLLVIAAHPDDAELGCGGTIAKHVALGLQVGVVDLTRGELGTRGTPELREAEASESSKILGLSIRENLGLRDGFFQNNEFEQLEVVKAIRKFRPEIVLANAITDRHPDHGKGSTLAYDSSFLAGLSKVKTPDEKGSLQQPWRPRAFYNYIQSEFVTPDFIVDISDFWETKINSIKAFKTQFFDPSSDEPETYISSPAFLKKLEARSLDFGHTIGVSYGEGFTVRRFPGVKNLFDLL
jgi:bacillithiol biosynthesis deacetylase BshB1